MNKTSTELFLSIHPSHWFIFTLKKTCMICEHTQLPHLSVLKNNESTYNYIDSFEKAMPPTDLEISQLSKLFFQLSSPWMKYLVNVRNFLVSFFDLDAISIENEDQKPLRVGDDFGFFHIYEVLDQEIVLGKADKHLDFKVSIIIEKNTQTTLRVSTLVTFKNNFGKFYFRFISFFHKKIIKAKLNALNQFLEKTHNFKSQKRP